jgi:hypothetical protein
VRPALLREPRTPGAQPKSGPFIRYSSCSTSRLREGVLAPAVMSHRHTAQSDPGRSRQEHLRAASAHRFSGCAAATTASCASSLLHCQSASCHRRSHAAVKPAYDAVVTVVCNGLLVESSEGVGECDEGEACQALGLRGDYEAYRAAHGRVIADEQVKNRDEYGGEA